MLGLGGWSICDGLTDAKWIVEADYFFVTVVTVSCCYYDLD